MLSTVLDSAQFPQGVQHQDLRQLLLRISESIFVFISFLLMFFSFFLLVSLNPVQFQMTNYTCLDKIWCSLQFYVIHIFLQNWIYFFKQSTLKKIPILSFFKTVCALGSLAKTDTCYTVMTHHLLHIAGN